MDRRNFLKNVGIGAADRLPWQGVGGKHPAVAFGLRTAPELGEGDFGELVDAHGDGPGRLRWRYYTR